MREEIDTRDLGMARIAARQHGVIAVEQLYAVGLDKSTITRRIKRGHLHRMHRGVYAVGHRGLSWHRSWMAAVLACGEGAVLSHGSAAALWGLLKPIEGPVHVSTPSTSGRSKQRGIHLHRAPSLNPPPQRPPSPVEPSPSPSYSPRRGGRRGRRPSALTTHRDNIPTTTVPRTIEDLRASSLPSYLVRRAIRQAEFKGLRLDGIETDRTRSDLESLFLTLVARYRLPRPEVNVKLGRFEVDFLWRAQRLVVETDSFLYHRGSVAFQDDYARDLDLRAAGYAVLRFSEQQLEDEPERVAADVAAELQRLSHGTRGHGG
jgi:very-short-patch-repair endonuclease